MAVWHLWPISVGLLLVHFCLNFSKNPKKNLCHPPGKTFAKNTDTYFRIYFCKPIVPPSDEGSGGLKFLTICKLFRFCLFPMAF